ncbi:hypothetical protein NUW58_g3719 [Xylaria curta]|uniref:Uncharacterized protein n=1 Tax=Xylaria curta TaxID=42375 RepID=A0ACC1PA60_9PEZI|nr:hypothetical protein NUW58_g3719 [Xylaria curta]
MGRSLQHRSLGDAFVNLLSRSIAAALDKRQSIDSISNSVSDAATAFSSWDNCFQAAFCKWPVIALFIIAGLIIVSVVWCICCGECCGLCDPPHGKRSKYLDEPFVPPNHDQAYRSQAPMHAGFDSMKPSVPQYAEFDTGNKKDADALPAMPSWEEASSKKVLIEGDSVEMAPLKKPDAIQSSLNMNSANMSATTSPRAVSPYGPPAGPGNTNAYMTAGHNNSAYGISQQGYNQYDSQPPDQPYSSGGMNNVVGGAVAGVMGRHTPQQDYNNGYDRTNTDQGYSQYPQSRTPRPYNDEVGRSGTPTSYNNGDYRGMPTNDSYGNDRVSPGPHYGRVTATAILEDLRLRKQIIGPLNAPTHRTVTISSIQHPLAENIQEILMRTFRAGRPRHISSLRHHRFKITVVLILAPDIVARMAIQLQLQLKLRMEVPHIQDIEPTGQHKILNNSALGKEYNQEY